MKDLLDVYTTVECNDEAVPLTDAQVQALATDWAAPACGPRGWTVARDERER